MKAIGGGLGHPLLGQHVEADELHLLPGVPLAGLQCFELTCWQVKIQPAGVGLAVKTWLGVDGVVRVTHKGSQEFD
ncbi:hypothetical protein KXJ75_04225 [Aeromonas sanarellii]|nr:hypothetical protein KXJ75_04225 [Aeromonas sanarellii]